MSRELAYAALEGIGDAALGEWMEPGANGVVHVRRRLSDEEAARVGPVRDVRGLPEERRRIALLLADAPRLAGLFR